MASASALASFGGQRWSWGTSLPSTLTILFLWTSTAFHMVTPIGRGSDLGHSQALSYSSTHPSTLSFICLCVCVLGSSFLAQFTEWGLVCAPQGCSDLHVFLVFFWHFHVCYAQVLSFGLPLQIVTKGRPTGHLFMCGCDDRCYQMGIPLILKNWSGSVEEQEGECRAAGVSLFELTC